MDEIVPLAEFEELPHRRLPVALRKQEPHPRLHLAFNAKRILRLQLELLRKQISALHAVDGVKLK